MTMKAVSLSLLIGFTLTACMKTSKNQEIKEPGNKPKPGPEKPVAKPHAIVFGDSFAASFGAKNESSTIAACLTQITKGQSVVKAASGATTHQILAQIKAERNGDATLVFLSAGSNDVMEDLLGAGFTEEETFKNFAAIIEELKSRKTKVVYLALSPPLAEASRLATMNRMAVTAGFQVVDAMRGLWDEREYMADRIYPNDRGYQKICERLIGSIK